ncbi:Thiamin ABC transporter, ATPase component / Thiamine transport ATP-binding protein thiQ [Rubellimicrobium mesophilum DSM 19309]|uniref:Thiamin ABC transporter, ATPase component / Thiamine transport ATP-binding protein thiQ n=1 Tax=Rubellimicrobium mesophilum DSM 19309 TaxID=442562 RepID=A0A017HKY0_9RHOB|nr:ATP-binding cassette domain-containing protein [Rubellimicrobium mesophilum]EYD75137.1 Thiamin ABC transporter, ATPase component / Thiamine transport ATP-binding protein thiQ [Rubellimicrobium mesophilum DSM 19309]
MLRLDRLELQVGAFRLSADLEVPGGASVAVMGPSGGGKSTLLSAIAGFLAPVSGRVLWDGRDLGPLSPGQRPVGVLFQDNNLFPHLTALQNVALGLRPSLRPRPEERARAEAALARVGLGGLGDRRPAQLSGGQQGRAALARLLVQDRPLVLMDEPFAALGPALKAEMLTLTREVLGARGATLLMVTHDPEDARAIAESVIVVAEGRAAPPVPTEALLADPPPALRAYLG